jgi:hypothetical protein
MAYAARLLLYLGLLYKQMNIRFDVLRDHLPYLIVTNSEETYTVCNRSNFCRHDQVIFPFFETSRLLFELCSDLIREQGRPSTGEDHEGC